MQYAIFDIVDMVFIGTSAGPKLFDDHDQAVAAARIVDVRLNTLPGRHRAVPWKPQAVTKHDDVMTKISALEALMLLEGKQ